jgi:hypothetical protein
MCCGNAVTPLGMKVGQAPCHVGETTGHLLYISGELSTTSVTTSVCAPVFSFRHCIVTDLQMGSVHLGSDPF